MNQLKINSLRTTPRFYIECMDADPNKHPTAKYQYEAKDIRLYIHGGLGVIA
ncbi:13996_t:CDS:2 [Entrophospora sp. SA101]|nr:13996_t:CDS:2 [Entrophospora sp. SA101]